jgi:probable HAF family extracellular repeat protein
MAQAISYNYETLNDTFATNSTNGTYAFGINDGGTVVGYYYDASGNAHGFSESGGSYVNLDYPGVNFQTFPEAINKEGQIVGWYNDVSLDHGFLYSNGSFTALNDPSGGNTWARGINDQGHIVGYFQSGAPNGSSIYHGFVYENGIYTTLDDPLAPTTNLGNGGNANGTVALGINNHDQIVGYYYDSNHQANGFLYSNGKYTTLDDPLGVNGTFAAGINDKGQIVGWYQDQLNSTHGFVYSGGTYTTVEDPLGGGYALGINNKGQIVGYYGGADRLVHGFVATPAGAHSLATSSVFNGTVHTLDTSNQVAQLVQAMAGFGASSGSGDSLNTVAHNADTSQQSFLTMPHQHT